MILRQLLNTQVLKLIRNLKIKHPDIWDVAIYGSVIRGKVTPVDIDIAIILHSRLSLNEKLKLAHELRHSLRKLINYDVDVKTIDIKDLLDKRFIARQSIIAEGFLLLRKTNLSRFLGFNSFYIFSYSLQGLTQSKKVMFQYALNGRNKKKGLLDSLNGFSLGKGVVMIPVQNTEEFKQFLDKNKINYKVFKGMFY